MVWGWVRVVLLAGLVGYAVGRLLMEINSRNDARRKAQQGAKSYFRGDE